MKRMLTSLALVIGLMAATGANAACYAAYKAKQDAPLRLHYGVVELKIDPCEASAEAEAQVAQRIGRDGWALLQVVRMLDEDDVESARDDAGEFFLRY